MKFTPIYNKKHRFAVSDRASFSTDDYTCMFILQTMKGQPVAVSRSNDPDCNIWRVQHGFSTIYFGDYADAMDYCRERFCDLEGKPFKRR